MACGENECASTSPPNRAAAARGGRLTLLDGCCVALVLALTAWSGFFVYRMQGGARTLDIRCGAQRWTYPLDQERVIRVRGPLGETEIEIRAGAARVCRSPCANGTCIAHPPVQRVGEWNACLPNGVFLYVHGTDAAEPEADAVQ